MSEGNEHWLGDGTYFFVKEKSKKNGGGDNMRLQDVKSRIDSYFTSTTAAQLKERLEAYGMEVHPITDDQEPMPKEMMSAEIA